MNGAITPNNTKNVSVGKGVKGGYMFAAPIGTPLPSRYDVTIDDLDPAFDNLGYISEDGITNAIESDSENYPDMNGDTVETASSSYTETYVFSLLEQKKAALAQEYGLDNVTDEDGQIVARHNSSPKAHMVYVLLLLLKDGRRQVSVIADGQVTEVGEKQYNSTNLVMREITMTAYPNPDWDNDTVRDYIESTETLVPMINLVSGGQPVMPEPFEGKALSDLVGDNYKVTYEDGTVKATGDVYQVDGWKAYGKDEQNKHYPVFMLNVPAGTKVETTTLAKKARVLNFDGPDNVIVAMEDGEKKRSFTLTDTKNPDRKPATLVFDATGCTFATKE